MTAAPLLALLSLSIASAPTYELGLGARSELRLRHPGDFTLGSDAPSDAWDSDNALDVRLTIGFPRAEVSVAYVPRLTLTPGTVRHPGPATPGQDNEEIYGSRLGLSTAEIARLRERKVI